MGKGTEFRLSRVSPFRRNADWPIPCFGRCAGQHGQLGKGARRQDIGSLADFSRRMPVIDKAQRRPICVAARTAYAAAGIGPADIDIAEVHFR